MLIGPSGAQDDAPLVPGLLRVIDVWPMPT